MPVHGPAAKMAATLKSMKEMIAAYEAARSWVEIHEAASDLAGIAEELTESADAVIDEMETMTKDEWEGN